MQEADREKFTIGLQALATVLRFELTEAIIEGYWQGLEGVELVDLGHAMRRAWRESRFMPSPAELRGFARHARAMIGPPVEVVQRRARLAEAERQRVAASWGRQLGPVQSVRQLGSLDDEMPRWAK